MFNLNATMNKRVTERRLVDVIVRYFRKEYLVARELRHYEKRIDIAYISKELLTLYAVEAKTKNWIEAVEQAIVNLAAANRSYIAIYSRNIHRVKWPILQNYGIGLISVGTKWGDVNVLLEAKESRFTNKIVLERLIANIQKRSQI